MTNPLRAGLAYQGPPAKLDGQWCLRGGGILRRRAGAMDNISLWIGSMSRSGVRGSEGESLPGAPGFLPLFPEVSRKRHCRRPNFTICSWFLRSCRNCTLSWWAPLSVSRQILLLVVRGRA